MTELLQEPEDVFDHEYNIAMVIDGKVVQIFNVNGQEAAWYLSDPTFLVLGNKAKIGWIYQDGEFISPK